jgi:integration host factor subunit beta
MVKSELIDIIFKKIGLNMIPPLKKRDLDIAVNIIFESMKEALINGNKVEIRGFGSFRIRKRRARIAKNPRNGSEINLPAKKYILFRAGKDLKKIINEKE